MARVKVGVVGWWRRGEDDEPMWEEDTPYMSEDAARRVFNAAYRAAKAAYRVEAARAKSKHGLFGAGR